MANSSSFYGDTPNYSTTFPTQNDSNTQPVTGNTKAPSSFYPNGTPVSEADPVAAANSATQAAASATAAANSATAAAASLAGMTSAAGSATPLMDGVATVGVATNWSREDHVHPTDTSRAPLASPALTGTPTTPTAAVNTNTTQIASTAYVINQSATSTPLMDGVAAVGTGTTFARADHVHPTDTSRAPLASPTFTGTPAAPTPAVNTNTTQLATTAYVINQASAVNPLMNGTAAVGTATKFAREDHVHPSDTSRLSDAPSDGNQYSRKNGAWSVVTGAVYVQDTAPVGANAGSMWWNSASGALYVNYNDGTSTQWVQPYIQTVLPGAVQYDSAQSLSSTQQNQAQKNIGLPAIMRSYLAGLTLSTAGSSTTMTVAPGVAADSTNVDMMTLAAAISKTTSSPWGAGSGLGGMDTGLVAINTWYHFHLIKNISTQAVDVLFSLSATAPTLPSGYTLARRIGSAKTNGSGQWTKFIQDGDTFQWDVPVADVSAVQNPGTAAVPRTITVPTGVRVQALVSIAAQANGTAGEVGAFYVSDLSVADTPAGNGVFTVYCYTSSTPVLIVGAQGYVFTNTSAQIRTRLQTSDVNAYIYINTNGWIDRRGRDS